jgi:hypothetical protein
MRVRYGRLPIFFGSPGVSGIAYRVAVPAMKYSSSTYPTFDRSMGVE